MVGRLGRAVLGHALRRRSDTGSCHRWPEPNKPAGTERSWRRLVFRLDADLHGRVLVHLSGDFQPGCGHECPNRGVPVLRFRGPWLFFAPAALDCPRGLRRVCARHVGVAADSQVHSRANGLLGGCLEYAESAAFFQRYLFGFDIHWNTAFDFIAIWRQSVVGFVNHVFSLATSFLAGLLGVYFLQPDADVPLGFRIVWKLGLFAVLASLLGFSLGACCMQPVSRDSAGSAPYFSACWAA